LLLKKFINNNLIEKIGKAGDSTKVEEKKETQVEQLKVEEGGN